MATKKYKINPVIKEVKIGAQIGNFKSGECFIMDDELFMRDDGDDFTAVNLETGEVLTVDDETIVTPINITINWNKKGK